MGNIDLPFGPWREIFSGTWTGYDVSLSENPDRLVLTIIYDKEKDKVTGMVFMLDKFYVVEGDPSRLSSALGGYNIIFDKIFPAYRKKFFIVSSGPKYAKSDKEEMDAALQEIFNVISDQSERANELSKSFEVSLTELKYAKEEDAEKLFSEPTLMPAIMVPGSGRGAPSPRITARTLLGKKTTGENAEENIQSFLTTLILGNREERKSMAHVMLENCVLSGITTVVFDDDKSYERMATPNKNFDYKTFPDIQPIGMPLKNVTLQEVGIDMGLLTPEMFREIIGIVPKEKDYLGRVAAELIDEALSEGKGQIKSLLDVQERLSAVKDESKKFHICKAVRLLKLLDMSYPGLFDGKVDLTLFISPYLRSIGSVVRIDTGELSEEVRAAFMYSVITSLYKKYKEEMATKEVKIVAIAVDGYKIAPSMPATYLQKGVLSTLVDCGKYGVGVCLGAEHDSDVNEEIVNNVTIRLESVGAAETAVREVHSRPYRMRMRPSLSS